MHSIRKYRNWAVLLLIVLSATVVVASTPGQSTAASPNAALAPSGPTSQTLTTTGPVQNPTPVIPPHPRTDAREVAFFGADYSPLAPTLYDSLVNYYGETVTRVSCINYTPTLDEFNQYEVVIVWSNYAFDDPGAMGDNCADYIDGGGRVIQSTFSWYGNEGWGMGGRLKSETPYQTFNYSTSIGYGTRYVDEFDSGHPITQDLSTSLYCYYQNNVNVVSTATWLANWNSGYDFVALSENEGCVGINMYVGSADNPGGPWCRLYYNAIEWTSQVYYTDVGVNAIRAPSTVEDPGVPVAPLIRIKNFAVNDAYDIDVTVRIWDETDDVLVYDELVNYGGPLRAGDTVSLEFPDWTPGTSITYACTTFTALSGDERPRNDTAKRTVATIGWKDIPKPTTNEHRLVHGTAYDKDEDMLYMYGGNPDGYLNNTLNRHQRYDPEAMEWTDLASMPTGVSWVHGSYVNGKIYVYAGLNSGSQCIDDMQIYDISSNTWSQGTPLDRVSSCYLEVEHNGLIYIMGGIDASYNTTDRVDIYDPSADAWMSGTNLPQCLDMGSACIIGDTIFLMGGLDRTTYLCLANVYKGYIDPGDPTNITWIEGPAMDPNDAAGGCAAVDEFAYMVGGFTDNFYYVTDNMWRYSTVDGTVEVWDVGRYPSTIARNHYLVARNSPVHPELYCLAGDLGGNWSTPNNMYKRMAFPPKPNDVGVSVITMPTNAQLTPGETFAPACSVKNYGTADQTGVLVQLVITDAVGAELWSGTVTVDVPSFEEREAVFPDFSIPDSLFIGRTFYFTTMLDGDQRPGNDAKSIKCMTLSDEVYSYYGGEAPVIDGYIDPDEEWDDAYTFDCSNIFGWKGGPQGPGAAYAYFKNDDDFLYICVRMPEAGSRDNGDKIGLCIDENNDGAWSAGLTEGEYQIWVNGSNQDEIQYRYHSPSTIGQWTACVGSQSASSTGWGYLIFEGKIPLGTSPYKITLDDPTNDTVGLYMYTLDGSKYYGWFRAGLSDLDWNTPSLYGKLVFMTPQPPQQGDVGVSKILAPVGNHLPNTEVTPKATWKNFGTTDMTFTAYAFLINPSDSRVYSQSLPGVSLAGGASVDLEFDPYTVVDLGDWVVKCSTAAAGDINASNDWKEGNFTCSENPPPPPGWREMASLPAMPSGRAVKDGGCLAYDAGTDLIYGSKGYKTGDFYAYDVLNNAWAELPRIPFGIEGKEVYKGSVICADGNGKLYLTKGNNTVGFWEYDAVERVWNQKMDVPYGLSGKRVKQGAGIAWATKGGVGAAYLLKGFRNEFFKYDPVSNYWTMLPAAPVGWHLKWDAGSWIVADPTPGAHVLYAHKAKYHEFYAYDTDTDVWGPPLTAMPIGSKKAKDGSCAAYYDGKFYAFKGGNTTEFWCYDPVAGTWAQLEDIPLYGSTGRRKKVRQGGALAGYPGVGVFAFKGNKCNEFWRYGVTSTVAGAQPSRDGVTAGSTEIGSVTFAVAPNPLSGGLATVRYSLPKAGLATLYVYDVTGRTVLEQTLAAGRTGTAGLDLRKLDAGVYLVKVATEGFSTTQKLVVQH